MWAALLEWCAGLFGVTTRGRLPQLVVACVAIFVVGVVLAERWGISGVLLPALVVSFAILAARQVMAERDRVWRAACLPVSDLERLVGPAPALASPTAEALHHLAASIACARRGEYATANEGLALVDRALLTPEELHLFEAVRALVSLGLGDTHRAARVAVIALPTGSEDLDAHLGRTLVADAWDDPGRLRATMNAWQRAGVSPRDATPLGRLEQLVRVRIDPRLLDEVQADDARALADEARTIGDEALAVEIEARGRGSAYR